MIIKKLRSGNEIIEINETQYESSFWHEFFHAIQWHAKGCIDEFEAQTYAGLMIEFLKSANLKIVSNET